LTNRGNIKKMCAAWVSLSQSWHHGSCVAKVPSHVAPPYGLQGMMIVPLYWDFTNKNMGIQWVAGFMGSGKTLCHGMAMIILHIFPWWSDQTALHEP